MMERTSTGNAARIEEQERGSRGEDLAEQDG